MRGMLQWPQFGSDTLTNWAKWEVAWLTQTPQGETLLVYLHLLMRHVFTISNIKPSFYDFKTSGAKKTPKTINQSTVIENIYFKQRLNSNTSAGSDLYSSTSSTGAWNRDDADSLCKWFSLRPRGSSSTYLCFLKEFMLQQLWGCWPEKQQNNNELVLLIWLSQLLYSQWQKNLQQYV